MGSFELLKNTNSKLGQGVHVFSLPAVQTCPGRGACESFCYAARLEKYRPVVGQYLQKVLAVVQEKGWEQRVLGEITAKCVRTVRIHAHGDFNTVAYVRSWIEIVKAAPDVSFFAYTRSWCVPRLYDALNQLRTEPNMKLYSSIEPQERDDPRIADWLKASIIEGYKRDDTYPGIVCPEQMWRHKTGSTKKAVPQGAVSCSTCRHCIDGRGSVQFVKH